MSCINRKAVAAIVWAMRNKTEVKGLVVRELYDEEELRITAGGWVDPGVKVICQSSCDRTPSVSGRDVSRRILKKLRNSYHSYLGKSL